MFSNALFVYLLKSLKNVSRLLIDLTLSVHNIDNRLRRSHTKPGNTGMSHT